VSSERLICHNCLDSVVRYTLNICKIASLPPRVPPCHFLETTVTERSGDVGGQRTLRPYWRNYFEQTDALVWVIDSSDKMRMCDCRDELRSLLTEDVRVLHPLLTLWLFSHQLILIITPPRQRLAGASLLVFANKQDLQGSMTDADIRQVSP